MKLVTAQVEGKRRVGRLMDDGTCLLLSDDLSMIEVIQSVDHVRQLERGEGLTRIESGGFVIDAPIHSPEKLICIGKNYADHALEMGSEPPSLPVVFSKFASAITGPKTHVRLPKISDQVDFEAELVVVIGQRGKEIDRTKAMDYVFGYTCGNDISARDWQKGRPGGQWLLGKTFDSFAPLGPAIVTNDEINDVANLDIKFRLDGEVMQKSNTAKLIFPVDFLISHLSQFVTLKPGDLIFTGTPSGVGAGRKPPLFLQSGNRLEVEIQDVGVLENTVVMDS